MDLLLLACYVLSALFSRSGIVPALAFVMSVLLGQAVENALVAHIGFAVIYLALIPLSNTRVATGMLLSSIVNFVAATYFLSPLYLDSFVIYFAIAMSMVNLYILFTILKGVKNESGSHVDDLIIYRALDLCNIQTHTKTNTGR